MFLGVRPQKSNFGRFIKEKEVPDKETKKITVPLTKFSETTKGKKDKNLKVSKLFCRNKEVSVCGVKEVFIL